MHRTQIRRSLSIVGLAAGVTMLVLFGRSGVEAQSRGGAQRPDRVRESGIQRDAASRMESPARGGSRTFP